MGHGPHPDTARQVAGWGVLLYALVVLFQRFAVPGSPVSLLLPLTAAWALLGIRRGLLEVDRGRLVLWLAAAGATGLAGPLQVLLTPAPLVSMTSWGLMMATLLPVVVRARVRDAAVHRLFLQGVSRVALWFGGLSYLFMGTQLVGVPYRDWFATVVPGPLQMPGYVYTYPIAWQSPIYRSNAWIGLEASWTAFLLGLGVLATLLAGGRPWRVVWLLGAMLCTFSGSGFQLVAVGVAAMLLGRRAHLLRPYLWTGAALLVVGAVTPVGQSVFGRVTEVGNSRSSTALRAVTPYLELWPAWVVDLPTVLLGRGAGASQRLADDTGITGLLAPTLTKVFMDYGLVAGSLLFALLVGMMMRSPQPAVAVALAFALWTIQTPTAVFLVSTVAMVTVWAPSRADGLPFEARTGPPLPAPPSSPAEPRSGRLSRPLDLIPEQP